MSSDEKIKLVLSDLGRATLRGIRRCPKCGTYNGTRGLSCKKCNCSFKEKRKFNTDACKLVTGNSTQIYSVKVHDKGPDHRGFVQLPLIQAKLPSKEAESFAFSETALCFVDSCQRLFDTSILKCHETDQCLVTPACQHIEAAVKCTSEATALPLTDGIIGSLNVEPDVKQELYLLASHISAPLVQRITKNVMAIKCQVSAKHPLGYLHFSFYTSKVKEKLDNKYYCSCSDFKDVNKNSLGQYKNDISNRNKKCIHLYACICTFASDLKLAEEFGVYLNMEQFFKVPLLNTPDSQTMTVGKQLMLTLDDDLMEPTDVCNVEVEVLNENALLQVPNISLSDVMESAVQVQNLEINANGEVTILRGINDDVLQFSDLSENLHSLSDSIHLPNPELEIIAPKKSKLEHSTKPINNQSKVLKRGSLPPHIASTLSDAMKCNKITVQKQDNTTAEERKTQVSFVQWLASVTERINQTMHYQFNGNPDALIFHVPQVFFDCLRERLSFGGTKKRLPNGTSAFIRKEAVPMGTFTKYTWHITNILHVKQVFETPLMSLQVTKSFIQNHDGTYDLYMPRGDENDGMKNDGMIPIKPLEHKTYLKVGNTSHNQVTPTPFIIEWIPDILPLSKVGELRIKFEYGHQKESNGFKTMKLTKRGSCTRLT